MTRRTEIVHITAENRDKGRTYIITEMDAFQGEDLAVRVLLAMASAGSETPDSATGIAGLASMGVQAIMIAISKIPYPILKPILNEMLSHVGYQHAPRHPPMPLDSTNVDETSTLFEIRKGFLNLHLGFLKAGVIPTTAPSSRAPQPMPPA